MELFCEYFSSSEGRVYAKFKKWLAAAQFSFPLAVILSVGFHAVILIFLFLSAVISSPTGKDLEKSKRRAIYEALKEETNLSVGQGKKIAELLKGFDVSGADLDENEKVQLFKRLIGSYLQEKGAETEDEIPQEITREDILSSLRQSGGIALGSGKKVFPSVSPKGKQDAQLNTLPKPVIKDIRSLQKFPRQRHGILQYKGKCLGEFACRSKDRSLSILFQRISFRADSGSGDPSLPYRGRVSSS